METMTLHDVAMAVDGRLVRPDDSVMIHGVSTDTRTIQNGELYVPLRGERFDGHDFIPSAIQRGAVAVIAEERYALLEHDSVSAPIIVVPDSLRALQQLALWYRQRFTGPVIAVTGSNGKTTTKDMISSVLRQHMTTHATHGNLNSEIGLPLTLLQREPYHQAVVVEMGMRGHGQIEELTDIAQPTIGVVTNVGAVHLELLHTVDDVARAKAELVRLLPEDGWAVLNADDERVAGMAHAASTKNIMTYGFAPEARVRASALRNLGEEGVAFCLHYDNEQAEVHLGIPGRHNVMNALAAAAVGILCDVPFSHIVDGLAKTQYAQMRMQLERLSGDIIVLNDAYNASPASMQAALETLQHIQGQRHIALLGDMFELGDGAQQAHHQIGQACAARGVDVLVTVGELSTHIAQGALQAGMTKQQVFHVDRRREAWHILQNQLLPGDVVLVKASRGMALEKIVQSLRDDRWSQEAHNV